MRIADGFGVERVYFSGITPYPDSEGDSRLPHIARRTNWQIHKTALGAENSLKWTHALSPEAVLKDLSERGYKIIALEQTDSARPIIEYQASEPVALMVGNEISGLPARLLKKADVHLQIPMLGVKESHNAAVATAIALYHLRFIA
jgi:23S rRNA (guanosine2251-2'-O)-methyltransferase